MQVRAHELAAELAEEVGAGADVLGDAVVKLAADEAERQDLIIAVLTELGDDLVEEFDGDCGERGGHTTRG